VLEREAALAELIRRYFTSHGPATIKDCAWWSGLSPSDVRIGLELNTSQLEMARVDGQVYWFGADIRTAPAASPIAHLLPAYDEYTIAYKDHNAILHPDYQELVVAAFGIVIVIDGQIVGAWKRVIEKHRVLLTLEPFRALNEAEQQVLNLAVQRYQAFLGKPIILIEVD
jgi:hypothetical protein